MNLYPCAYSMTFNVSGGKLNGILNQRSNDMIVANNWNVVQYSVLLIMMAQVSGLVPGELVHVIADAHIYDRHFTALKEMLLNRDDTNWAGSLLMAEYKPEVMDKVAKERIRNATAMHYNTMVTASVSEYTRLKSVCPADFTVLSLEELVLAAAE